MARKTFQKLGKILIFFSRIQVVYLCIEDRHVAEGERVPEQAGHHHAGVRPRRRRQGRTGRTNIFKYSTKLTRLIFASSISIQINHKQARQPGDKFQMGYKCIMRTDE